jgi:peptide-methionine (S)-S-oxide reductase
MKWFSRSLVIAAAASLLLCACQDKAPSPAEPVKDAAENNPGEKATATEPKSAEPAPVETKPAEPGPAESKPAETKPAATAPAPAPVENAATQSPEKTPMKEGKSVAQGMEVITLGGGCFWCTEAVIERLEGVSDVVSGYMGGHVENPTYEQICTKTTGHAEVIQVTFDPSKIKLEEVLDVFWQAHDPTTLNRQGADQGPQYRSVIFYHSPEQKNIAMQSKAKLDASGMYENPAVTEISEAAKFWEAEDYHQNYYVLNKDKNPYCRVVISPKLKKLGME